MKDLMMLLRKEVKQDIEFSEELSNEIYDDVIKGMKEVYTNPPKVLVIDLGLNRISGLDCLNILRSNPKYHHTKIIVTAKAYNKHLAIEAFNSGADYFVKLPLKQSIIERIIELSKIEESFFDI